MALTTPRRRKSTFVVFAALVVLAILLTSGRLRSAWSTYRLKTPHVDTLHDRTLTAQIEFWRQFQPILRTNAPNCPSPTREEDVKLDIGFTGQDRPRPDLLTMTVHDREVMLQAHHAFVDQIQRKALN